MVRRTTVQKDPNKAKMGNERPYLSQQKRIVKGRPHPKQRSWECFTESLGTGSSRGNRGACNLERVQNVVPGEGEEGRRVRRSKRGRSRSQCQRV